MAEFLMKHLVKESGRESEFEISSAATSTDEIGNAVYPPARKMLAKYGIKCEGHSARQLRKSDYDYYDLLIGMDEYNIHNMQRICGGDPQGKIYRLLDFTPHPRNIADPWYTRDFAATWADCLVGCRALLEAVGVGR